MGFMVLSKYFLIALLALFIILISIGILFWDSHIRRSNRVMSYVNLFKYLGITSVVAGVVLTGIYFL